MSDTTKEKAPQRWCAGEASGKQLSLKFSEKSTAREAQIQRVLDMLREGPRNTYEFRSRGISHPAQRILDLQARGWSITSSRITTVDSDGFTHVNVALYSLSAGPGGR